MQKFSYISDFRSVAHAADINLSAEGPKLIVYMKDSLISTLREKTLQA